MDKTNIAIIKIEKTNWAKKNPVASKEITDFLIRIKDDFGVIPGYQKVLISIIKDQVPLKWFNYFSQIRCANFLRGKKINVSAFDKKTHGKVIDLEISNKSLCEVKSFEPKLNKDSDLLQDEELVFNNFLTNKLTPAFEVQKADFVIIDDIFSYESKNYHFLDYFMSFATEPETDRYNLLHKKLGKYLPKILVLSFTQSMVEKPIKRFVGDGWRKILS